jgi:transposase
MNPYPIELRQKIIRAVDQKVASQQKIAEIFGVSARWIRKLIKHKQTYGSIEPLPRTQGRKPAFDPKHLQELEELLLQRCDITLAEIQEHFAGRINCSYQAVANAIKRLNWGYKKNRYERLNRIETM